MNIPRSSCRRLGRSWIQSWMLLLLCVTAASVSLSETFQDRPGFAADGAALVADPDHPDTLWAVRDAELFRSQDRGSTWRKQLLPERDALVTRIWAPGPGKPLFVGTALHGLFRSLDGGTSWHGANQGLAPSIGASPVTPAVTLASSPASSRLVYLADEVGVLYRSEDSGGSWVYASNGLPVPLHHRGDPPMLAVDTADAEWVYAVLAVPLHSHLERSILFRTADAGRNWIPVKKLGDGVSYDSMRIEGPRQVRLEGPQGTRVITDGLEAVVRAPRGRLWVPPPATAAHRPGAALADGDSDGIAVIHDDGTLVFRPFDLDKKSLTFQPNAAGSYDVRLGDVDFQPELGTQLQIGDDDSRYLPLPFPFMFFGRTWGTLFVNSNGTVSFGSGVPSSYLMSEDSFLSGEPQIAALWQDFDPRTRGGVFVNSSSSAVVVTWNAVPQFYQSDSSTFQIVLRADGTIRFNYNGVAAREGLTGISNGGADTGQWVSYSLNPRMSDLEVGPIYQIFTPVAEMHPYRVAQRFYRSHDDDYDALVVFGASEFSDELAGGSGIVAYNLSVRNETKGVGRSVYDDSSSFGSSGRLQSFLNLNTLSYFPVDPAERIGKLNHSTLTLVGEEWGHRFLAFPYFRDSSGISSSLLGRSYSHWNYFFNSDASVMEGNEWKDDGNGSFTAVEESERYGPLDQYLMGLRAPGEVGPFLLINSPEPLFSGNIASLVSTFGKTDNGIRDLSTDFGSPDRLYGFMLSIGITSPGFSPWNYYWIEHSAKTEQGPDPNVVSTLSSLAEEYRYATTKTYSVRKVRSSAPASRFFDPATGQFTGNPITVKGVRKDISINDIIEAEGERFPTTEKAQKAFRHAFVLLTPAGKEASPGDVARLASLRRAWEAYYSTATEKRGSVSTSLAFGLSRVSDQVPGSGGRAYDGLGGAAVSAGYARLEPGAEPASAMALIASRAGAQVISEAAVPAGGTLSRARCSVERTTLVNTGLAIASPLAPSSPTLELRDTSGAIRATQTINIAAGGQVARFVPELFPGYSFPSDFKGSITITSTVPVAVVALRTILNQAGEFLITTLPVADLDSNSLPSPLYLPQFVDSGGYVTQVQLVNPGASVLTGKVEFYAPDGQPMAVSIGGTTTTNIAYRLEAHGAQFLATQGGAGTVRSGYMVLRADDVQRAPIAGAIFTLTQAGVLVTATGVAPAPLSTVVRLFVDRAAGHDTGVALVNPGDRTSSLFFAAASLDGAPAVTPVTVQLGARGQRALFVSQLISSLPEGFRGTLKMESDVPVAALALHSTVSGNRFLLATLPVEVLMEPRPPRVLYVPHLADGGGFSSCFVVLNVGKATSSPSLSFFAQNGQPLRLVTR